MLADFCLRLNPEEVFLLRGYAGTGKTSLIKTLVKTLPAYKRKTVLLAPTGRAAKVMSQYSGKAAFTIHKFIYRPKGDSSGGVTFNLRENKGTHAIFIVDEASMINDGGAGLGSLLSDLLQFVRGGVNCKLVFVGDMAQLPPVGVELSPALDARYLSVNYGREVADIEMTEVMRQAEDSGILRNATQLRVKQAEEDFSVPQLHTSPDVVRLLEGYEVEEALQDSFALAGSEDTAILVRSNKRAALYNRQIRVRILGQEDEISAGDYLMVVKNNYYWLPQGSRAGFIANGDTMELLQIYEQKEIYGFRFARVKARLVDYPGMEPIETMILLDVLDKPSASLSWEESGRLYNAVMEDYMDIPQKYLRHKKVKENEYYNALQVKFSYAITGHKAQGGQWKNVFIEKPWMPEAQPDMEHLRWLYTAFTRASEKIYLIGFPEEYFA